jgi:hypothetical protein
MTRYRSRAKNPETSPTRHYWPKIFIAQLNEHVMLVVCGVTHDAMVEKSCRDPKLRRGGAVKVQGRGDVTRHKIRQHPKRVFILNGKLPWR